MEVQFLLAESAVQTNYIFTRSHLNFSLKVLTPECPVSLFVSMTIYLYTASYSSRYVSWPPRCQGNPSLPVARVHIIPRSRLGQVTPQWLDQLSENKRCSYLDNNNTFKSAIRCQPYLYISKYSFSKESLPFHLYLVKADQSCHVWLEYCLCV